MSVINSSFDHAEYDIGRKPSSLTGYSASNEGTGFLQKEINLIIRKR